MCEKGGMVRALGLRCFNGDGIGVYGENRDGAILIWDGLNWVGGFQISLECMMT